jgi:hypothetical protein
MYILLVWSDLRKYFDRRVEGVERGLRKLTRSFMAVIEENRNSYTT